MGIARAISPILCAILVAASSISAQERLSPLAPAPDWSRLQPYQKTITREEFIRLINEVYSPDGGFWKFSQLADDRVIVFSDTARTHRLTTLYFAADQESQRKPPRLFAPERLDSRKPGLATSPEKLKPSRNLRSLPATQPLEGIRICLDPGHIGGEWSRLEERYFRLGQDPPVEEAELNWITCQLIAEKLTGLGATVSWSKSHNTPSTPLRPAQLRDLAIQAITESSPWPTGPLDQAKISQQVTDRANRLFYGTAEIFSRAETVSKLKPDLTLCIHYNAASWGDPLHPTLVDQSKLVFFVSGAFMESELAYDDHKFHLLHKLLDHTAPLERRAVECIALEMEKRFLIPAETYTGWNAAKKIGPVPGVFARNLLANRTFPGPVAFIEGPYMNARDAYPRLIAGDYEGKKGIDGKQQSSVFRDYADAVAAGVLAYFNPKPGR